MHPERPGEPSFGGDLHFILKVLREKRLLIGICILACGLAGLLYAEAAARIYAAKVVLQVDQEEGKVVNIEGVKSEDLKSEETLKTFEQNLTSPEVLLRIVNKLKGDPGFLPEVRKNASDDALQEALSNHVDAKIRRGTRLIDITVEHKDPRMAQRIAALLGDEFIRWNFEARQEAGRTAGLFLNEEAERLQARLAASEAKLQEYKEQNAGVPLEEQQNITVEKLKELSLRATVAKAERLRLESDCAQLIQLSKGQAHTSAQLLLVPGIANTQAVVDLKRAVTDKEVELKMLSKRYRPEYPKYIQAQAELDELNTDLAQAITKAADVLSAAYQSALLTEQKLDAAMQEQQKRTLEADKVGSGYTSLARNMDADRALYDSVKTRLKETEITKDIDDDAIRVVSHPLLPDRPVKPRKKIILALSLAAGLALGCGAAFVTEAADRSFRTLEAAEHHLGLRSLGEIPKVPLPKGGERMAPALMDTNFAAEESFRTLRTSLSLIGENPGLKTFLFTSARPGEGKTYCAIKCAVSFAQLGLRTLLIDADCRMPRVARIFFDGAASTVSSASPAAVSSATTNGGWESAVRSTHISNLSVLSADKKGLNSAEFVAGSDFEEIMRKATVHFDRVVVDTAPVQEVSDTLLFAKHAQAVCLVIHSGRTPAEDVTRAAQRLAKAGAPLAGFVWNQVTGRSSYYYGRAGTLREAGQGRGAGNGRTLLAVIEAGDGISSKGGDASG